MTLSTIFKKGQLNVLLIFERSVYILSLPIV